MLSGNIGRLIEFPCCVWRALLLLLLSWAAIIDLYLTGISFNWLKASFCSTAHATDLLFSSIPLYCRCAGWGRPRKDQQADRSVLNPVPTGMASQFLFRLKPWYVWVLHWWGQPVSISVHELTRTPSLQATGLVRFRQVQEDKHDRRNAKPKTRVFTFCWRQAEGPGCFFFCLL